MVSRRFMPPERSSTLALALSVELRELEQLVGLGPQQLVRQAEVAAVDEEVVADPQLLVQVVLLRHHAQLRADLGPVLVRVEPDDAQVAGGARDTAPIIRMVVDLPAPLGPSSPKDSPAATSKEMPSTAAKSP